MLIKYKQIFLKISGLITLSLVMGLSGCTLELLDRDEMMTGTINGKPYRESVNDPRGTIYQTPSDYKHLRQKNSKNRLHKGLIKDKYTGGFYPVYSTDGKNWIFTTAGLIQRNLDKSELKKKKAQEDDFSGGSGGNGGGGGGD